MVRAEIQIQNLNLLLSPLLCASGPVFCTLINIRLLKIFSSVYSAIYFFKLQKTAFFPPSVVSTADAPAVTVLIKNYISLGQNIHTNSCNSICTQFSATGFKTFLHQNFTLHESNFFKRARLFLSSKRLSDKKIMIF
ncbi:UNVERIFIED_CONTAM: hypothetical protein K2H54_057718 [Gekko kuhli]